jgi:hypothetical protein
MLLYLHSFDGHSILVLFDGALGLWVDGVEADLLVVLLQGGEVLAGLRELSLLHPLPHIPVQREKSNKYLSVVFPF